MSRWTESSENLRPIRRLMSNIVFSVFSAAWFFAASPTRRSPDEVNATYDGVIRFPISFGIISIWPPREIAAQEYVVPRSIPIIYSIATAVMMQLSI